MASVFIEGIKYIILFLFAIYVLTAFYILRYDREPAKQMGFNIVQKILLLTIHGFGFFCLYIKNESVEIIGFYLLQVLLFVLVFLFYHLFYKKCSVLLLNNMCMLVAISMIVLTRLSFEKAYRQFIFLAVGVVAMLIIPLLLQKGSLFRRFSIGYFVVGAALLAYVTFMGSTSYGAKLTIDIAGFSFQPSEFVKIIYVFFIAAMLYKDASPKRVLLTSFMSAVFVLLLVASKDLGGALLYFMAYLAIIYVASKNILYFIAGIIGISGASVLGYHLFSHVQTRVAVWLDPTADIDNQGYQICQSLFGIGTGGWFGFGIGEGLPTKIPVVDKDFIFSAISEEFGAIFAIGVLILCVICFISIMNVAVHMTDSFYKYVATGLAVLYATQVILTVGGAVKFIPSTGVTLPLVSYGGSSLISTLCMFGIVQGLYIRNVSLKKKSENAEKQRRVEINVVQYSFVIIFLALTAYFIKFVALDSDAFIYNDYNSRMVLFEDDVIKGQIISSDGYMIAETDVDEDGNETRRYPYKDMFSHVLGYSQKVKTGLEKQLHFRLISSHTEFTENLLYDLSDRKIPGDNVITTLDFELQRAAYSALGSYDGAVVVMEPSTGKVLVMVSKPGFDPNTVSEDWEELQEGSALYNRASQGLYAPGSIFKILTLLAYMESNPDDYQDYSYTCTGEITVGDTTIHCASGKRHGEVDLEESFAESCNTSFANMMYDIDEDVFQSICDTALFNQELPIAYESMVSSFSIQKSDIDALKTQTAIGQGNTLVSPLHMAMLAGAICNDGVLMRPQLIERVENYKEEVVEEVGFEEYGAIFTEAQTDILSQYMQSTVEYGTASKLSSDNYTAYGKTGTAQVSSDIDDTNAWFVGYAEADGKEIAIAVIVEDSGYGSKYAVPIAKKVFDFYFE